MRVTRQLTAAEQRAQDTIDPAGAFLRDAVGLMYKWMANRTSWRRNDMPDVPPPDAGPDIGLAEMIESLRRELETSLERGKSRAVAFAVEKVELELKVAVSRKAGAEAGVAFWVVKAGASVGSGRDTTHTFKLTLAPVLSASGERLLVESTTNEPLARD